MNFGNSIQTKLVWFFITVFIGQNAWTQDFNYVPAPVGNHQIVNYTHFSLSYNEEHEQADWVAYELTREEVAMDGERCSDCFARDTNVSTGSATDADYSSSGFDRGHMAPSADFYQSPEANRQTFLYSNMSPQSPLLNRGIWAELEDWVRMKALAYQKIYVITGPVFINNLGSIGANKVTIPGYFYKVLLRFDSEGKAKSIGFLIPNIGATGTFENYVVPVNLIETITGIDFFPELSNRVENSVESQVTLNAWSETEE